MIAGLFASLLLLSDSFSYSHDIRHSWINALLPMQTYKIGERVPWQMVPYENYLVGKDTITCQNSSFVTLKAGIPNTMESLCKFKSYSPKQAHLTNAVIKNQNPRIRYEWIIDGIPTSWNIDGQQTSNTGQLGFMDDGGFAVLFNHFDISIHFRNVKNGTIDIVSASVRSCSLSPDNKTVFLDEVRGGSVDFTFTLIWIEDNDLNRWNEYLTLYDPNVNLSGSLVSFLLVLVLALIPLSFLIRLVKKDIYIYNEASQQHEKFMDDFGWKLVHSDVFRTPKNYLLLLSLSITGIYMFGIFVELAGIYAIPWNDGVRFSVFFAMSMATSFFCARYGACLYELALGRERRWRKAMLGFAIAPPIILYAIFEISWHYFHGPKKIAWLVLSICCGCMGSHWVFSGRASEGQRYHIPTRVSNIPRQIPRQTSDSPGFLIQHPVTFGMGSGLLVFSAGYVQLYHIFVGNVWGITTPLAWILVSTLTVSSLLVLIATLSCLTTYLCLCQENYAWWWRSFSHSLGLFGFLSVYALYSLASFHAVILVNGLFIALLVSLVAGTVSFLSSLKFNLFIYSQLKDLE